MVGKSNPWHALVVAIGGTRLRQRTFLEAAPGDADSGRHVGDVPEESGAALGAEVAHLVVVQRLMMEGIDGGVSTLGDDGCLLEVGRYAEGAASAALAVGAAARPE